MTLALGASAALVALAALGAGPVETKKIKGSGAGKMLVEPAGKEIPAPRERSER